MYLVLRTDSTKDINDQEIGQKNLYKSFKTKKAALAQAYIRNQMIVTQVNCIEYMVYDKIKNQLLRSVKVA